MSNVKISALPVVTVGSTDAFPIVQGGVTKAATFGHTHPQSDVTDLTTDLAGKAATSHTHTESDITNLVSDLTALQNKTVTLPSLTPLDQSTWTWFNQGTATVNQSGNIVTLISPASASGTNLRGRLRGSYPTPPFTLIVTVQPWFQYAGSVANLQVIGLTITDGTKHKTFVAANFNFDTANAPAAIWVGKYASATSATSATVFGSMQLVPLIYLKLVDDNTNQTFSYSFDGQQYIQVLQEGRTTHLTPSDIGIVVSNQSGSQKAGGSVLSWALA